MCAVSALVFIEIASLAFSFSNSVSLEDLLSCSDCLTVFTLIFVPTRTLRLVPSMMITPSMPRVSFQVHTVPTVIIYKTIYNIYLKYIIFYGITGDDDRYGIKQAKQAHLSISIEKCLAIAVLLDLQSLLLG